MKKRDYQGKRKDQVDFSENMVTYGLLGMIIVICTMVIVNIFENF